MDIPTTTGIPATKPAALARDSTDHHAPTFAAPSAAGAVNTGPAVNTGVNTPARRVHADPVHPAPVHRDVHAEPVQESGVHHGDKQIHKAERALSIGTWLIVFGAMLYSVLTVTPLMAKHTPDGWEWTAPILPLVVDAAVVIVVRLDSVLARLDGDGGGWPVVLRWMTGIMTLALNTADSALKHDKAGVAVHAVAPLLLIVTAETGLAYRRAITAALTTAQTAEQTRRQAEHAARQKAARESALAAERKEQAEREARERELREQREHAERLASEERQRAELQAEQARHEAEAAAQQAELARQETQRQAEITRQAEIAAHLQELELQQQQEEAAARERERHEREREQARAEAERQQAEAERVTREREQRQAEAHRREREREQQRTEQVQQQRAELLAAAPVTDKLPEDQALRVVQAAFEAGLSVRAAAARCGWSIGWVNNRFQELRNAA
ncbi:coiled-coil domain-containing protein [Actinomadura macrotermitis]|uniref:DUF2637 domain-containing protein n=1 Tax=Actinomadura macrotermitis TaxID=2585200 RepID=A0A7K0C1H8_9ACTN|nr:hypothetical protein [Actinomadura macrotermitis]MQY07250.1 hypothetical protein [Actinomadura macrotermitis]